MPDLPPVGPPPAHEGRTARLLHVRESDIGRRSSCPFCSRAALVDDVVPELGVVLRHDAITWHVVSVAEANGLNWEVFFSPPYDTTRLRAQVKAREQARGSGDAGTAARSQPLAAIARIIARWTRNSFSGS